MLVLLMLVNSHDNFARKVIEAAARVLPYDSKVEGVEQLPKHLPKGPFKLTVVPLSRNTYGKIPARVVASSLREEIEMQVVLRVVYERPIIRLARDVPAGSVITPRDLETTIQEVRDAAPAPIADMALAVGKRARFTMKAGRPLYDRELEALPLFNARAKIRLVSKAAGISVSAPAEAQEAGALGASVRVMNLASHRMVMARVVDAQTVEIAQ